MQYIYDYDYLTRCNTPRLVPPFSEYNDYILSSFWDSFPENVNIILNKVS